MKKDSGLLAQLTNLQTIFFLHFIFKKKSLGKGPQCKGQRSLFHLVWPTVLISSCSVPTDPTLIPPTFTSLNPVVTFFRPLQPHSSSHNWGKYENSRFDSNDFGYAVTRNKRRTRNQVASEWVKKMYKRSWLELHFTTISHILSFNYRYRCEIDLIRIMYTANSLFLNSKDKTVRILGTWHQYLVNVSGIRYSKQIEFQEELINVLRTWFL